MIQTHQTIFSKEARNKYWILVRVTNKYSMQYVGNTKYSPKRMDCKAKTADKDVGRYHLRGLVVSPKIHPNAFGPNKLSETLAEWNKMKINEGKGPDNLAYSVDLNINSEHYGCLMFHNKYIHGDYDLFDIIDIKKPNANLALHKVDEEGRVHRVGVNFYKVQSAINFALGVDMIQHGGEAQYKSWDSMNEQYIDGFGPNGEIVTILNKYSLKIWYENRFGGRQLLG